MGLAIQVEIDTCATVRRQPLERLTAGLGEYHKRVVLKVRTTSDCKKCEGLSLSNQNPKSLHDTEKIKIKNKKGRDGTHKHHS